MSQPLQTVDKVYNFVGCFFCTHSVITALACSLRQVPFPQELAKALLIIKLIIISYYLLLIVDVMLNLDIVYELR